MIESLIGQGINVRHACRVLGVSESGYYDWRGRPDQPRTLRRIWLAGEIAAVHKASAGTYGEMRVTAELRQPGREILQLVLSLDDVLEAILGIPRQAHQVQRRRGREHDTERQGDGQHQDEARAELVEDVA